MSGRTTPKHSPEPDDMSSLRRRNPRMWWIAVITATALIAGSFAGALLVIFA